MASKTTRDLERWVVEHEQQLEDLQQKLDGLRIALEVSRANDQAEERDAAPAKMLRNEMVAILRERGEPMYYGHIHDRLIERGIHVPGKEPKRNVNAHLSGDQRFERVGDGKWGLASWAKNPPPAPQTSSPPADDWLQTPSTRPEERVTHLPRPFSGTPRPVVEDRGPDTGDDELPLYISSLGAKRT